MPPSPVGVATASAIAERATRALGDPRSRFDWQWTARLLATEPSEFAATVAELAAIRPVQEEIRRRHREAGRPTYAQFRAPLELYAMVRVLRPAHVIETGVSSGVSSAHLLLGLERNGRGTLHSVDLPTRQRGSTFSARDSPVALPPGKETGWAVPSGVRRRWDLRVGRSEDVLPGLVEPLPSVGLFLHDSLHTPRHLAFELSTVRPRLSPGGVVLADNTVWTGRAFPRFADEVGAPVVRRGRSDLVGLRMPNGRAGSEARRAVP